MNKKPVNANPTKEFFTLVKTIESKTKNQARISSYNPDDISSFIVEVCPQKGVYQHAKFLFQIQLMLYPREFPNVICLSDIYHPNIEYGEDYHNVCLNLFDNWNRSFGLIDVIQGLIFLLYQPNIHDPISSLFNSKNTNDETFRKNVQTSLQGGIVDGVQFLPNPGIIEYNESQQNRLLIEQTNGSVENSVEEETEVLNTSNNNDLKNDNNEDITNEIHITSEDLKNDGNLTTIMSNNNAAEECTVDHDEETSVNGDEQIDEDLPTRDVVSQNAFYSDLICSRYAQPDRLSESEYDSNDLYHASIVFDLFGFQSSNYESAESDLYGGFETSESDWNGNANIFDNDYDDDDDNDDEDGYTNDNFVSLSANGEDPSNIFYAKWLETRRYNNQLKVSPASMTAIILTEVFNPFHAIVGIFFLYEDSSNWVQSYSTLRRIENHDRSLHFMAWVNNICRWAMTRQVQCSFSDLGCDQIIWYSLFVTLSVKMRTRIGHLYNYGSDKFDCLFIR